MNQKKTIVIILIVLVLIGLTLFLLFRPESKTKKEETKQPTQTPTNYIKSPDGTKKNISRELTKEKIVEPVKFINIRITQAEKITAFEAECVNISDTATQMKHFNIHVLNKEGKELATIPLVADPIPKGGQTVVYTSTRLTIIDAYDVRIEEK